MAMKLSTGKMAFPIEFDNGDRDCIYFNPNDPDLAKRLFGAKDRISKKVEDLNFEDLNLTEDKSIGELKTIENFMDLTDEQLTLMEERAQKMAKVVEETNKIIYQELNDAFGSDVSSVVFKHCSPFAVVNGEYFVVQFLSAIVPEVKKSIEASNTEIGDKMSKHLNKYSR